MPRYKVLVDDNFHYMEEDARYERGTYDTPAAAVAECRAMVDGWLQHEYQAGTTAEALYEHYTSFGEDPFIVVIDGTDAAAKFSAWTYAKERCAAICGK
jgi:hypothetical protein